MPGFGDDYKTQVRAATDIVQLIGRTVALKRSGSGYIGLCPFHQEKSPSFHVNPAKQFFYCYGCKAGGDVFSFVEKRDRIEFAEALRLLGEQAGIEPPRSPGAREKKGEKQLLLDMQSAACAFFEKLLAHPQQGAAARAYIESRHINAESIKRFQIGYAPDAWDGLLNALGKKFSPQQLELGGLLKPRTNGPGHYDVFRNRVILPIRDQEGRVIAFGGRILADEQPKYLNSPETPLFQKSKAIFGLDLARQKMVETRVAVVVEGYMDVVIPHQFGIENVVSPLGTALTEQHVTLLRRFVDKIVLLFDGDSAGDAAMDRVVGLFLTQPVEIAIASMPAGMDPDEYIVANGAAAFQGVIDGAIDALSYKWKLMVAQFGASAENLTGQQRALEAYLDVLAAARGSGPVDALRWGGALARVSRLTGIPVEELNRRFGRPKVAPRPPVASVGGQLAPAAAPPSAPRPLNGQVMAERWVLGVLLLEPARWHDVQKTVHLEDFQDPAHRRLAETYWNHQRDEGEPVFNEFLASLRDDELTEIAVNAVEEVDRLGDKDSVLSDVYAFFERNKRVRIEQKLVASSRRIGNGEDEAEEIKLLRQLSQLRSQADLRRPAR